MLNADAVDVVDDDWRQSQISYSKNIFMTIHCLGVEGHLVSGDDTHSFI